MSRRVIYCFLVLQVLLGACGKDVDTPEQTPGGGGLVNPLHPGESSEPVTFTIASCNVLKPSGRCDEMSMDNATVRQTLAKSIMDTGADIIGFNELDENYIPSGKYSLPSACSALEDFSWSLEWPNKPNLYIFTYCTYSYANGFAYNNTKFKLEDSGYVWLSKEENTWYDNASSAYNKKVGNPERTCVWAKLTHIESRKAIWLFVTHLPTDSQGGANNMARVVNNFASLKAGSAPSVLTGDMNSAPGSAAYSTLTSYWNDGNTADWGTLSGSSSKYYYTVDVFTKNRPDRRIDHIMTRKCKATDYHTVVVTYPVDDKPWCPSDHLPVVASITY